jgi:hypothetical protein
MATTARDTAPSSSAICALPAWQITTATTGSPDAKATARRAVVASEAKQRSVSGPVWVENAAGAVRHGACKDIGYETRLQR